MSQSSNYLWFLSWHDNEFTVLRRPPQSPDPFLFLAAFHTLCFIQYINLLNIKWTSHFFIFFHFVPVNEFLWHLIETFALYPGTSLVVGAHCLHTNNTYSCCNYCSLLLVFWNRVMTGASTVKSRESMSVHWWSSSNEDQTLFRESSGDWRNIVRLVSSPQIWRGSFSSLLSLTAPV